MTIQCPHCGASGQLDDSKRPIGVTSIKCPRCSQSFPLPPAGAAPAPPEPPPLRPCPSCGGIIEGTGGLCSTCQAARNRPGNSDSSATTLNSSPGAAGTGPSATCEVCKGRFDQKEMVRFGTTLVCGACKPTYVQMLSMGLGRTGDMRFAGFWIRFGAKLIDGIILWVVNFVLTFATAGILAGSQNSPQMAITVLAFNVLIQLGIAIAYNAWFLSSKYQATPGKIACGLKVVTAEGGQITGGRAIGRYFAEILSSLILMIGYIMAAFDDERRALHDRICNTRVIYK